MSATQVCPPDESVWLHATDAHLLDAESREHIDGCARCQARSRHLQGVDALLPAVVPADAASRVLGGNYELQRRLGRGGFGEVWLAHDRLMDRSVAIKMLRADRFQPAGGEAFLREARLLAKLTDDPFRARHIVPVYSCGKEEDRLYLVMRHVEGGSLGDRLRQYGPLSWRLATRYVADVAEALAGLHDAGLVHRDIKPDNILWDSSRDEALLADFGIAARLEAAQGAVSGTPGYMAPELFDGECSGAADVFSLAATLYHLLTGRAPFAGADLVETLDRARLGIPMPDPGLTCVPESVDQALRMGLVPAPGRRATLKEFQARLRGAGAQSLLASVMIPPTQATPDPRVGLDLALSVLAGPSPKALTPVQAAPQALSQYRDLELVPPEPDALSVPEGNYVQLKFASKSGGYLTLLNVGSSGTVTILFPGSQMSSNYIVAGGSHSLTLRIRPPAGTDEAIGILTRSPSALLPDRWLADVKRGQAEVEPYRSYRDLELIAEQAEQAAPGEWTAVGVKITH